MEDYSDPCVWQRFLERENVESKAPPPPKRLHAWWERLDSEQLRGALLTWAHARDLEARSRESQENFVSILEMLEGRDLVP